MLAFDEDQEVAATDSKTLASQTGAYAELTEDRDGEALKVYSSGRKLIFEYNPVSGRTTVFVPSGDLEFVAQQGDITFTAARGVSINAQTVQLTSHAAIMLSVTDLLGRLLSSLTLQSQRTRVVSPEVAINARRGNVQIDDVRCTAKKVLGRVEHARLIAGKLERFAKSVLERATDVYTTVDGMMQLKAGRLRTLLDDTYHFKAKRVYLKAQEDFKINADTIHLG